MFEWIAAGRLLVACYRRQRAETTTATTRTLVVGVGVGFILPARLLSPSGFPQRLRRGRAAREDRRVRTCSVERDRLDKRAVGMSVDSGSHRVIVVLRPHRVIVVLRPTVSGLDESAARRMFDAVRAGTDADVRIAYLDVASPSLHEELDRAHTDDVGKVVLIPVAVPRDRYLLTWTSKAVANWRETRIGAELEVSLHESETLEGAVAAQVIDELGAAGKPITASPASYRSPAWSVIEQHDTHLLVCKGPRCMAYGAGPLRRAMSAAAKGTSVKVTGNRLSEPVQPGPVGDREPRWHLVRSCGRR